MLKRFAKALFFLTQDLFNPRSARCKLRIGVAHFPNQIAHQAMEERPCLPELVAMAQCAPDNPPKHVAPALVARDHPVDDQEAAGADVIGDDLQRIVGEILATCLAGGRGDECDKQVDFVIGMHVLEYGCDALKAHPGVHARLGQGRHVASRVPLELHEDEVPDFDIAIAVLLG